LQRDLAIDPFADETARRIEHGGGRLVTRALQREDHLAAFGAIGAGLRRIQNLDTA